MKLQLSFSWQMQRSPDAILPDAFAGKDYHAAGSKKKRPSIWMDCNKFDKRLTSDI